MPRIRTFFNQGYFLLVLIVGLFLSACSAHFKLITNPEGSSVFTGEKNLGKTPIEFDASELEGTEGEGYFLRIESEGYKRVWLWLPDTPFSREISLNINPFYVQNTGKENSLVHQISPKKLDELSDKLLNIQTQLMLGKQVEDKDIEDILNTNPYLASAHFLAGLQAVLKNQREEAKNFLKDAIRYNSEESDFQMLQNEVSGGQEANP